MKTMRPLAPPPKTAKGTSWQASQWRFEARDRTRLGSRWSRETDTWSLAMAAPGETVAPEMPGLGKDLIQEAFNPPPSFHAVSAVYAPLTVSFRPIRSRHIQRSLQSSGISGAVGNPGSASGCGMTRSPAMRYRAKGSTPSHPLGMVSLTRRPSSSFVTTAVTQ